MGATASPRQLLVALGALVVVGAVCVALLAATGVIGSAVTTILVVGGLTLAMSGVVLVGVRRVDAKVQKALHEVRQHSDRLNGGLTGLTGRVGELEKNVSERTQRAVTAAADASYAKLEAVTDLRGWLQPRAPMPALHSWALKPDVLHMIMEHVWREQPGVIVECGSGSSSVWLGYVLERMGKGRVIALEHDERYLETSRDLIRAHGLEDYVEVRHAPLEPWRDGEDAYSWYALDALDDIYGIDLLLVDGPPGPTGPQARYPAVPILLSRCSPEVMIVLDDTVRDEERAISDRWLAEYPDLRRRTYDSGGFAHIFTW